MSDISMCECDGPPPPPPHLRDDEVRVGQHVEVLYGLQQRAHHPHGAGGGTALVLQGKRGGRKWGAGGRGVTKCWRWRWDLMHHTAATVYISH